MTQDLVRRALEESLETGLKGLAREAETVMLLIDTSGSMLGSVGMKRRIDVLREVVASINPLPPMIAFGGPYDAQVRFVDVVPEPDGGTPLHDAIPLAKSYGATRLVVISDGMPDLRDQCLIEARSFNGKIDVVFIGTEGDSGSVFLAELARITGGSRKEAGNILGDTKSLTSMVVGLLEGEVEQRAPIQGAGFTTIEDPVGTEDDDNQDDDDEEDDDEEE